MAYSDTIRTAGATMEAVASLIDGALLTMGSAITTSGGSTTTSTSLTNHPNAGVTVTVPSGGRVICFANVLCSGGTSGAYIQVNIQMDGVTNSSSRTLSTTQTGSTSGYVFSVPHMGVFSPSAGSHTFRIVWSVNTGTAYSDSSQLYVFVFQ